MCRLETRGATSDVLSTPLAVEDVKPNSTSFKPYALQGTTKAKAFAQYSAGPLPEGLQWSHHSKDVASAQLCCRHNRRI